MPWPLTVSYWDYLVQFSALVRDPIYRSIQTPRGNGEPILLIPGFLGGDWTLLTMAGWLNGLGYRAYFSGINWNIDCPNRTGELLRWRLDHIIQETGRPIIAIGHSLGGVLARFLSVNFSEKIRHAIALGSPLDRSMRVHPLVRFTFQMLHPLRRIRGRQVSPACGSLQCSCPFSQTAFSPLPAGVGFTSIFSKQDEVVDWRTSVEPQGDNREVSGRHIGLIVNPEVYRVLAHILAIYKGQGEGRYC